MADSYKNSIKLGITLKPTSEVQKELTTAIQQLEKNSSIDLKIDTKQINQSLKYFGETLNNISNQMKNGFNFGNAFNAQASSIEGVTNKLKEEQQAIEKTANDMKILSSTTIGKSDSDGNITEALKTIEQLQEGIGKTTRLTTDLKTGLSTASNTENFQKLDTVVTKLQNKLNKSSNNKFINESVITELQNKLNGINTNSAEKEIKELQQTINNLSSSDSQIVRLQNTISKMENNLTNMKGKYGSLVGDSSSREQLNSYTSQIEKLKTVMASLQSGGTISGQKLASELNLGTNASRELSNAVKNSSSALKLAQNDATTFGESIKRALQNTGIYMGAYQTVQMLTNSFKDATKYVIQLDSAMTNLKKVTQETNQTYSAFLNQAHDIAMDYGSQSDKVVDATTSWAKTGESLKNATELAKSTMLLTKVGDVENVSTAQQYMIAPLKAFQIEADKSITLIDKYNNISNNMATSTNDLGEALSKSASSMSTAGNTLEQTLALIATAESQTKLGGDVVGQAMKTTSLRIATFKDENGELIPKFEKQLKALGVSMRDTTTGQILPTFEILKQVGEKFKTLDTNKKLDISQLLGGKLQANVVSSILNNVDELNRAYSLAQNSSNSAMNEFKTYQQGVQYSIDRLKESINNLYTNAMSSSGLKIFIDGLTKMISTFGNLPTVIGLATSALLIFKGQAIVLAIAGIASFVSELGSAIKFSNLFKIALGELDILISSNPLGLLAIAITSVVVVMDTFGSSLLKTSNLMEESAEKSKTLASSLSSIKSENDMVSQLESLNKQLDVTNISEKTRKELNEKIATIKNQLSGSESEYAGILTDENLTLDQQLAKIKDIQKAKLFDEAKDLDKSMPSQSKIEQEAQSLEKMADKYNKLKQAMDSGDTKTVENILGVSDMTVAQEKLGKLHNSMLSAKNDVTKYNADLNLMNQAGYNTSRTSVELGTSVDKFSESVKKSTSATEDNTKAKQDNKNTGSNAENEAKAEENKANSISKATDEYEKSIQSISKLQGYADKINKAHGLTPTLVAQITKSYPELSDKMSNATEAQASLNKIMQDEVTSAQENYLIMKGDDEQFYKDKIVNSDSFKSAYDSFLNSFNADGEQAYTIDFNKYKTLNALKEGTMGDFGVAVNQWLSKYVDVNASGYAVDLSNFTSIAKAKEAVLAKLNEEVKKINDNLAGVQGQQLTMQLYEKDPINKYGNGIFSDDEVNNFQKGYDKKIADYKTKLASTQGAIKEVNANFDGISASMKSFSGEDLGGTPNFDGNSGGSGKSKAESDAEKAQKEAEKYTEEIAKMTSKVDADPYFELNNAIKGVDNELTVNKTLLDSLTQGSPEYNNAMQQQIELDKKKQVALQNLNDEQKKQAQTLKDYLAQYGFTVDEFGNLNNSQSQIQYWQGVTNALAGSTEAEKAKKQEWIDWIKTLGDKVSEFTSLNNDKIPSVANQWNALGNEIKKSAEEIKKANEEAKKVNEDLINTEGEKLVNALKQEYEDAKTTELKNLKEEYQSDVDDLQDEIDSRQKQLDSLDDQSIDNKTKLTKLKIELANLQKDNSTEAQVRIQSTQTQISELEKTIQKDDLQSQIDDLNKQKSAREDVYNQDVQDKEDSYKELEDEHKLYNEAEELLTTKNTKRIKELLNSQDESFKQIGTKLGEALNKPIQTEVENTITAINNLISKANELDKVKVKDKSSSSSSYEHTTSNGSGYTKIGDDTYSVEHPYDDATTDEIRNSSSSNDKSSSNTVTNANGSTTTTNSDGTKSYSNGDYTDSKGYYHTAGYDTGGRTPDNIDSNGKIGILHASEKILNADDTVMIDQIYDFVKTSGSLINQMTQSYSNASNYNIPTLTTDLNKLVSSITNNTNTNNSNANNININNNYDVNATTDFDTKLFSKNIDKQYKDVLRKAGILKR